MTLALEKLQQVKRSMLDPAQAVGLSTAEMMDLLSLALVSFEAMHASAPPGMKCADCSIDDEPCIECYRAHWTRRHPGNPLSDISKGPHQ